LPPVLDGCWISSIEEGEPPLGDSVPGGLVELSKSSISTAWANRFRVAARFARNESIKSLRAEPTLLSALSSGSGESKIAIDLLGCTTSQAKRCKHDDHNANR
jgi:hypothetical protein